MRSVLDHLRNEDHMVYRLLRDLDQTGSLNNVYLASTRLPLLMGQEDWSAALQLQHGFQELGCLERLLHDLPSSTVTSTTNTSLCRLLAPCNSGIELQRALELAYNARPELSSEGSVSTYCLYIYRGTPGIPVVVRSPAHTECNPTYFF